MTLKIQLNLQWTMNFSCGSNNGNIWGLSRQIAWVQLWKKDKFLCFPVHTTALGILARVPNASSTCEI